MQIIGILMLFDNYILDMKTGEGKTVVYIAYSILVNKLKKKKVFIVSNNDYLARRDYQDYKEIFWYFNIKFVFLQAHFDMKLKSKQLYKADIFCATINEYLFDFLHQEQGGIDDKRFIKPE